MAEKPLGAATGIPPFLADRLRAAYGDDMAAQIEEGYAAARDRPVTLRANAIKATSAEVEAALTAAGIAFERAGWLPGALVLAPGVRERAVWDLDIYREGKVYMQSLSSMLPPVALAPRAGDDILDMCAAPGGKTSEMAALAPGAHITACELNVPRAARLEHNLAKLGAVNVQVMRTDARKLDEFFSFDRILLDAPCTGTGTLVAADPKAAARITPKLLDKVTRSQRALLDRALTVLKPGGTLVYSTCSVLPEENGAQVAAALGQRRHRDCELTPLTAEALGAATGAYRLPLLEGYPGELAGTLTIRPTREFEGFFVVMIKKNR